MPVSLSGQRQLSVGLVRCLRPGCAQTAALCIWGSELEKYGTKIVNTWNRQCRLITKEMDAGSLFKPLAWLPTGWAEDLLIT